MNHAKGIFVACTLLASLPLAAQQVIGVPGSPSATTTIDGKQLPPPPPKFGGVIKEDAKDSKPYWPLRVVPPKGAPNVLLIMTDDRCSHSLRERSFVPENRGFQGQMTHLRTTPNAGNSARFGRVNYILLQEVQLAVARSRRNATIPSSSCQTVKNPP